MTDLMAIAEHPLTAIISPLGIVAILLFAGGVLALSGRSHAVMRRLLAWGAVLLLLFFLTPVAHYLVWNLEKDFAPLLAFPQHAKVEYIVVLRGLAAGHAGVPVTGSVSGQTLANLSEAYRLYRLSPRTRIILSGRPPEAGTRGAGGVMADLLEQLGVPRQSLVEAGDSNDLHQCLLAVRKTVAEAPFILVAPACEMRRITAVAKKLRMNPVPAPTSIWTLQRHPADTALKDEPGLYLRNSGYISFENFPRLQWACHEYLMVAWDALLGRV